jgi:PRC-barrel domain
MTNWVRRTLVFAALSLPAAPAFAGSTTPGAPPAPQPASPDKAHDNALSADMEASLRKAGFTDLKVMPNSILVRGKDKSGNPVAMVLNPSSMTEVVTLDPHSGPAAAGDGGAPLTGNPTFPAVLPTARLASTLIGLKVRGIDGDEIGTVKDFAIDHGGVEAYIIATGGVMGIGDRYVAVAPVAITLIYDQGSNSYRATMKATADQMKAAPPFTYDGAFKAGRQ